MPRGRHAFWALYAARSRWLARGIPFGCAGCERSQGNDMMVTQECHLTRCKIRAREIFCLEGSHQRWWRGRIPDSHHSYILICLYRRYQNTAMSDPQSSVEIIHHHSAALRAPSLSLITLRHCPFSVSCPLLPAGTPVRESTRASVILIDRIPRLLRQYPDVVTNQSY